MTNPYAAPQTDTTLSDLERAFRSVAAISWWAVMAQLAMLGGATGIAYWAWGASGIKWGAAAYLAWSSGSRAVLARAHERGIRRLRREDYAAALPEFIASYDFFTRHSWIDRWRAITLATAAKSCYRETALVNIACCHLQLGKPDLARQAYQSTLCEFPDNEIARAILELLEDPAQPSAAESGEHVPSTSEESPT